MQDLSKDPLKWEKAPDIDKPGSPIKICWEGCLCKLIIDFSIGIEM